VQAKAMKQDSRVCEKYQSRSWQSLSLIIAGLPLAGVVEMHSFVNTFHVVLVKHISVTQQSSWLLYSKRMKEIHSGATRKSKKGIAGRTAALKMRIGNMFWYLPSPMEPDNGLNPAILSGSLLRSASQRGMTQAYFVSVLA